MPFSPVFRFAPSPNGRLHLGHAYSALLNATLAEKLGGHFLVRMEDIDITRCTPELVAQCLEDLAWLGLKWEHPVRVQSQHWDDYTEALESLKRLGFVYPCFCTRSEVAAASTARDPDEAPIYAGTCTKLTEAEVQRKIAAGMPHCWRLSMKKALQVAPGPYTYQSFSPHTMATEPLTANPAHWGDVILVRKDIPTSYHLSVVVDDALQRVTHVVRGVDLEPATCLHMLLQTLLGLPTPLYHHHSLLTERSGDKLSKSKGSEALADLRARGISAEEVREMVKPKLRS